MTPLTRLIFIGLALIWLTLWVLIHFNFWFFALTFFILACFLAWRVDAKTRKILRRRSEKERHLRRPGRPDR
jgi:membrane protein implicated in regulation of membrane protease activity